MLIPRYSIRWLLGLTTVSAGMSLVLAQAIRGHSWAIGVVAGLWTFVIVAVFYAGAFLCAWLIDQMSSARNASGRNGGSLFHSQQTGASPFGPAAAQPSSELPPSLTG